ncbi:MAG: hypothetical protein GX643_12860 [Acidimicrobiales bacterium]|nr:hypothetical protein [Acidimicrobiales bacterium]
MHDGTDGVRFALPWHIDVEQRTVSLQESQPIDGIVTAVLPDGSNPWPISRDLGLMLGRLLAEHGCQNILEIGAGSSSLVSATALAELNGGRITSLEQDVDWCKEIWARVEAVGPQVDVELVPVKPELRWSELGLHYQFSVSEVLKRRGPFDLVVVDAPQYWFGRGGALPAVRAHLAPGALLVLDDAGRKGERWALYRWLRTYPGLDLLAYDEDFGGRGVALLKWNEPLPPRRSVLGTASSITDRAYSAVRRQAVKLGVIKQRD